MTACSDFEKLRKSTDYHKKYDAAFAYYNEGEYYKASQLFDDIVSVFRGTSKADTVYYYQAMSYFMQKDYLTASHYLTQHYKDHPYSPFVEEAEFRAAYCYYKQAPRPSLDQDNTYVALESFDLFLMHHPNSIHKSEILEYMYELQERLVDKSYLSARLYFNMGQYKASIVALTNSLTDYPETEHREELMFLLLKSSFLLAENSIESKRKERYQAALDEYYSFSTEFPESKYTKEAKQMFAKTDKFLKARPDDESTSEYQD